MNYLVQPGDSPAIIAQKLVGDPRRAMELVLANPAKRRTAIPGVGSTFATLRAGESLTLPLSWTVRAALAGLPLGVGRLGLTPSITDTGATAMAAATSQLGTAAGAYSSFQSGQGTASDVLTAYNTAIEAFVGVAQQAAQAAGSAQTAIVVASPQGQGDPAAVQAQTDVNNIQNTYIPAITNDYNAMSTLDITTTDPSSIGSDAQTNAQNAVNAAVDAQTQATSWSGGGSPNQPPPQTVPANVVADAQAVLAAINADPNYCTSVGQNGSAVNTAVHNFKVDWNAAGLQPQVPVGTGQYESVTASAVGTAVGGNGPLACGAAPPAPQQTVTCADGSVHPAGYVCPAAPAAATTTNYTPWIIAGAVVLAAGIGYAVYRNRQHPTVARGLAATKRGAARVGSAARTGARRVGSAARRGYRSAVRRVAPARSTRRLAR